MAHVSASSYSPEACLLHGSKAHRAHDWPSCKGSIARRAPATPTCMPKGVALRRVERFLGGPERASCRPSTPSAGASLAPALATDIQGAAAKTPGKNYLRRLGIKNILKHPPFGIFTQIHERQEIFTSSCLEHYLYVPNEDSGSKAEAAARAIGTFILALQRNGFLLDSPNGHRAILETVPELESSL